MNNNEILYNTNKELINSKEFNKFINKVFQNGQIKKEFKKQYILFILKKINDNKDLNEKEKEYLKSFIDNSKVNNVLNKTKELIDKDGYILKTNKIILETKKNILEIINGNK